MAEVLVVFDEAIPTGKGPQAARVCGGIADDGLWEGWIEFKPLGDAGGDWLRSGRETEQPNLDDLRYWASGLSVAYLEGAFDRALSNAMPPVTHTEILAATQEFSAQHRRSAPVTQGGPRPILEPFSVYAQGEEVLRQQLGALSDDQLHNIAKANGMDEIYHSAASRPGRIDAMVIAVKARTST
ncbi:MAG: hypothetical protein H0W63_04885 [Gemmatimonadaceae bacterium]|nr:hypothetical protein [Gemmatimonadaceae bacterium]